MSRTPRDKVDHEREKVEKLVDDGEISTETRDALLEWADALDPSITRRKYFDADGGEKTLAIRSIHRYLQCLRLCEERGCSLLDCSAEEFNAFIDGLHDDRGLSKVTLMGYQCGAQTFYRYHDLGVSPDDIHVYNATSKPKHDERDMFTESEVDGLRDACNGPRDRAFLELLIYTGQRITALRTLRRKDIDVDAGYLYLNDEFEAEHGGLKGATRRGRKRPLLGARKYVRDWKDQYHPHRGDPDAALFVGSPSNGRTKLDEPWSEPGARAQLRRIAERAGVDKPVNPHNFRHYFVTVMKREYSMDTDTLRALLGVTKDSTVLDTVYSHVTNDDYVRKAEEQTGYREPEGPGTLTPDVCPTCGEVLKSHWRRCPACKEIFGPDVETLASELDDATDEALNETLGGEKPLTSAERRAFREYLDALGDPAGVVDRGDEA